MKSKILMIVSILLLLNASAQAQNERILESKSLIQDYAIPEEKSEVYAPFTRIAVGTINIKNRAGMQEITLTLDTTAIKKSVEEITALNTAKTLKQALQIDPQASTYLMTVNDKLTIGYSFTDTLEQVSLIISVPELPPTSPIPQNASIYGTAVSVVPIHLSSSNVQAPNPHKQTRLGVFLVQDKE